MEESLLLECWGPWHWLGSVSPPSGDGAGALQGHPVPAAVTKAGRGTNCRVWGLRVLGMAQTDWLNVLEFSSCFPL